MEYRWNSIKKKIKQNVEKTLSEQGIVVSSAEIDDSINLFDRIISFPLKCITIGNLQTELQTAIQRSYVDNIGSSIDLKSVLISLESYLKKLLILTGSKVESELMEKSISLKQLLQSTNVSPAFSAITQRIDEPLADSYDKDATGAYIFCKTYLYRNKVHESPQWDEEDVLVRLRYAMTSYILVTHGMKSTLIAKQPKLRTNNNVEIGELSKSGYLFDFMNYGHTTNQIKNQIVESFIVHQLYLESPILVDNLQDKVSSFFHNTLTKKALERMIQAIIPDKIDYTNYHKNELKLQDHEKERIEKILDEYKTSLSRFNYDLNLTLEEFGLSDKLEKVKNLLNDLFVNNYTDTIEEPFSKDNNCDYSESAKKFVKSLVLLGCPEESKEELFKKLMTICSMNNVLVRIALGKTFSNMSNPDVFADSLRDMNRNVYLDTQIILYALCIYSDFHEYSDNPYYVIVTNLIESAKRNPNIHLIVTSQYINEAAYHLKRAIQLIPFDDIYCSTRIKLSNNVFYSYYYYLKDNGYLNEGIDCLSDFLSELFNVNYEEILASGFESSIASDIEQILFDDFNIETEALPYYPDSEVENSFNVFTNVLLRKEDPRSKVAAQKDAIMGLRLFETKNEECEPIFLTWDKAFSDYRKDYKSKYQNRALVSWYLFSPGKFINHIDLLGLKINVDVMSEELISIIEDTDTIEKTKGVLDNISKLLERCNVSSRKQKKAYAEILLNETEFPNTVAVPTESDTEKVMSFTGAFDKLLTQMQSGEYRYSDYTQILCEESQFKHIVASMVKMLKEKSVENTVNSIFDELTSRIKK